MTTREWTKILKTHPSTSVVKIDVEGIKGTLKITRHRVKENEMRHYDFGDGSISPTKLVKRESEIDITFKGKVMSSSKRWHDCKTYHNRTLNSFLRHNKHFISEVKMRLKLIGGSSECEIKKITYL